MQIKNRQQLFGIVAIGLLVLLGLDSLVIEPLLSSWKTRAKTILTLQEKLVKDKALLAHGPLLESRWDHMRTNAFPNDVSAASEVMYQAFERWSTASKITVNSIKPQVKQNEDDYTLLECRTDASGNIDKLARFLHEIEKDPLAIRIESVEISSHDNNGQQLTLGLQISGLLFLPKEQ